MLIENLELGAVFQPEWDSRAIRILAFDSEQVMYDAWSPHVSRWGIDSLSQKISYYRLPTTLLKKARYLRTEEYTEIERSVHRPDLPFSFGRNNVLDWPETCPASSRDFPGVGVGALSEVGSGLIQLDAPKIFLSPFGPKGGPKPSVLITAENGRSFMVEEILWHAARLQFSHLRADKITQGLGIYRTGIQKTLPSFYIWGAKSRMGI